MAAVGSLVVDLIAQTASFNANITKAAQNLNSQAAQMQKSLQRIENAASFTSGAIKGLAASFLVTEGLRIGGAALDYAASLGEVSQQIGITVKDLQVYRYAATQVGLTQEEMEKGLGKLTQTLGKAQLGSQSSAEVFTALGISVRTAGGDLRTTSEIMPDLADKIALIKDPAQRAAVEVALFGKAGQKLDTLLTGGSTAISEMAKRASDLGMVMSDDLAASADEAADRIAEMKLQLETNISRMVAENAQSILTLANAVATLSGRAVEFIGKWPRLSAALAGAAAGARLGLPGAVAGGLVGLAGGNALANAQDDANTDIGFRQRKMREARETWRNLNADFRKTPAGKAITAEFQRQVALLKNATSGRTAGVLSPPADLYQSGLDLPDFMAPAAAKGSKGKTDQEKLLEEYKKQDEQLREMLVTSQHQLEVDGLRNRGMNLAADLLQDQYDIEEKFPQRINETTQAYAQRIAAVLNAKNAISSQSAVDDIAKNPMELSAEAQARIKASWEDVTKGAKEATSYVQDMAKTINDDLDYGIKGLIRGFGSLQDVAVNVLANIGDAIIDNLFSGINGADGTGGIGGAIASIVGGLFSKKVPGRAVGGPVSGGSLYMVGERGPELFVPNAGGRIVPNHSLAGVQRAINAGNDNAKQPVSVVVQNNFAAAVDVMTRTEGARMMMATKAAAMQAIAEANRRAG